MKRERILIIEDNAPVAENIAAKLMKHGYEISGIAANSEEAFTTIKTQKPPHLILIDLDLRAEFDGIEIASIISKAKSIPVLFLASETDEDFWQRAAFIGTYSYLAKPYQIVDIVAQIKEMLEAERMQKKSRSQELGRLSLERAFITINPGRQITFANFQAGRLLNSDPAHLIGSSMDENLKLVDRKGKAVETFFFTAESPKREVYESERLYLIDSKGNRSPVKIQAAPIINEEEILLGSLIAFENLAMQETTSTINELSSKSDLLSEIFAKVEEGHPSLNSIIQVHGGEKGNFISLRALEKAERRTEALNFLQGGHRPFIKGEINIEIHLKGLIQNLLELYRKRTFQIINLEIEAVRLPAYTARCLGIMASELISNALIHSKGTELLVSFKQLDEKQDSYELLVKDNGQGFDTSTQTDSKGALGFELIRHIIRLLTAQVRIDSGDKGTEVLISGKVK